MSRINRSPELGQSLSNCIGVSGLSVLELAKRARIGATTIYRINHQEDPKGVSPRAFIKVVEALGLEPEQKVGLYSLAGIDIAKEPDVGLFAARVDLAVKSWGLNKKNEALLQRLTLEHVQVIGGLLKAVQRCSAGRRRDRFNMKNSDSRWRRVTF